MAMFKVKLTAPVELTARCEITLEAEDEDKAYDLAITQYEELKKAHEIAMREYYKTATGKYPEAPFYWSVSDEDVDDNVNDGDIEIDEIWEED